MSEMCKRDAWKLKGAQNAIDESVVNRRYALKCGKKVRCLIATGLFTKKESYIVQSVI